MRVRSKINSDKRKKRGRKRKVQKKRRKTKMIESKKRLLVVSEVSQLESQG
jgi:hypothetical protein